jgi:peroxiredoxin
MGRFATALLIVGIASLGFSSAARAEDKLEAGMAAPSFAAQTLKRQDISLDALRGKVVLLHFWASWCKGCLSQFPEFRTIYDEHGGDAFEIVGISLDDEIKDARRAVSTHRMSWPQICDGKGVDSPVASSYDIHGTARHILIDACGVVTDLYVKPENIEKQVLELIASKNSCSTKETP